ncbi:MAG TPA: hypothetical protein VMU04_04940 [Candidatus Acidoferrum sp.]|nr:hypothetical protein [Candidatus Acidoferrum sp.]
MLIVALAFSLAGLLIVLGFVALLKQKTYLDSATLQPVEVELPVIGKVKSNYPAIIFVLLGFVLAYVAFQRSFPPRKVEWRVEGRLTNTNPAPGGVSWNEGSLTLTPSELEHHINSQGAYTITALIAEGTKLEDVYETLDYSNPQGSTHIDLRRELKNYTQGKPSLISGLTDHTRTFKNVDLESLLPPLK